MQILEVTRCDGATLQGRPWEGEGEVLEEMSWSWVFEDKSNFRKWRGTEEPSPDLGHQIKSGLQGNPGSEKI